MNWINEIDAVTDACQQYFSPLSSDELNWKPNPSTWSIAQNIAHLIVVNETYFPILASLQNGQYKTAWIAKIGFLVSFFGKTVLNAVNPDRRKKMKTFPIWEPKKSNIDDILKKFEQHQEELKHNIAASKIFIEKGVVISSPANAYIVYKLETAFEIIVTHEKRHLAQAKEVLAMLKKSRA